MRYYKVIKDKTLIGTATEKDLRCMQPKHNILIACPPDLAEFIQVGDQLYKAQWMVPKGTSVPFSFADVIGINDKEYELLNAGEQMLVSEQDQNELTSAEEMPAVDPIVEITADYVRAKKIRSLGLDCTDAICDGIDVRLEGNKWYHFNLEAHDQQNLLSAKIKAVTGDDFIPLHAAGVQDQYYTAEQVLQIVEKAEKHIQYHQAYYNSLKSWLNSMTDIAAIDAVKYGDEIPRQYQSDVLKTLILEEKSNK